MIISHGTTANSNTKRPASRFRNATLYSNSIARTCHPTKLQPSLPDVEGRAVHRCACRSGRPRCRQAPSTTQGHAHELRPQSERQERANLTCSVFRSSSQTALAKLWGQRCPQLCRHPCGVIAAHHVPPRDAGHDPGRRCGGNYRGHVCDFLCWVLKPRRLYPIMCFHGQSGRSRKFVRAGCYSI